MYYFMFHVIPTTEHSDSRSIGGAYVSCWIDYPTFEEAKATAEREIVKSHWQIESLEEAGTIDRTSYVNDPTGLEQYEQALISKVVFAYHIYPMDDRVGPQT
jgi:hypothetical protein